MRWQSAILMVGVAWALGASAARGEDSDQFRWYIGGRFDLFSLTHTHDFVGGEIGVNFNRYLGVELALDNWERKVGDLSELAITSITPQLRLRYPMLDDRLTPYLVAGFGPAVSQANDGRQPVTWLGGKTETHLGGTIGAGIEYFIADNIAVGWEIKQFLSDYVAYEANGRQGRTSLSSPLMGLSLRVFYPLLHPEAAAAAAAAATARLYVDLRTGGALLLDLEPFPGVSARPEQSVFGSNFTFGFGASLGADFGRYWSVELSLDNYEIKVGLPGVGDIGEYAVFPVMVQPRLRYPLFDDRLEPYVFVGLGAELGQLNDLNETGKALKPKAEDVTIIGGFGVGAEYYLLENVAIGLQTKYIISRGHQFSLPGQPTVNGDFDSLLLFGNIRILFADL
ncbi:outer membrane beta-barrel protein [bacterium]|nr:outer membrane beta-barrel protein [bacterium]